MKNRRQAYEEKLDAQLEEWNAKIALLKTRAERARAGEKIEYNKTIEDLEHRKAEFKTKLHELKTAEELAWEDLKAGLEKAWAEVKNAFHDAASKFK